MSAALRQVVIRYGSYPVVMLPAAVAAVAVASSALPMNSVRFWNPTDE